MKVAFSKYQATGNDFILIDNRNHQFKAAEENIRRLSDRHFGIGADGVIVLQSAQSKDYDFEMKFYNPDGSSDMFCGNGGRCIVAFARDLGLISDKCCLLSPDGKHVAFIRNNVVRLSMNNPSEIKQYSDGWFINTGTQHFVKFVEDADATDVYEQGRQLRYDSRFANQGGTNANFVSPAFCGIQLRTYERGVESETLSCGTGVTAAAVIYALVNNLSDNIKMKVYTKGGELAVRMLNTAQKITDVSLEGTAIKVFSGEIEL
ncbi:MAG: diaminopimelate epimerase [Bacteroidales bacterium]|jgi:diaminopimelate epimerase|nr:diaminopimelate epimerase [Bacteroidales bacterium]